MGQRDSSKLSEKPTSDRRRREETACYSIADRQDRSPGRVRCGERRPRSIRDTTARTSSVAVCFRDLCRLTFVLLAALLLRCAACWPSGHRRQYPCRSLGHELNTTMFSHRGDPSARGATPAASLRPVAQTQTAFSPASSPLTDSLSTADSSLPLPVPDSSLFWFCGLTANEVAVETRI